MRLHRLIAILLLLESRGQLKARELATALDTSERTIHRDIITLGEAGIPIEAIVGPTGGFRLLEGYTNHLPQLPHDEAIGLFLRGMGMHPREQSEAHLDLRRALAKLEDRLPEHFRSDVRIATKRFYFDPTPWWDDTSISKFLDTLRQAVWHSRKVIIEYEKASQEAGTRTVRPYGLVVKMMQWYLIAFCEERQAVRTFNVSRINRTILLDESFSLPDDFSLEAYWSARARAFKSEVMEREQRLDYSDGSNRE